jgi:hypothetical protein
MSALFMITQSEVLFIKEIIQELSAISDHSDYLGGEIEEAQIILDKLLSYDLQQFINIYSQIKELQNDER